MNFIFLFASRRSSGDCLKRMVTSQNAGDRTGPQGPRSFMFYRRLCCLSGLLLMQVWIPELPGLFYVADHDAKVWL
jgi:hypothetical protein